MPSYTLAEELWTDLRRMIPASKCRHISNSEPYSIDLKDGTHMAIRLPDHPDDLVSAGIDLLYMVEAARMSETAWLTVRPTLVSEGRLGRTVFNSTPKGQGWFSRLWQMCQDPQQSAWQGLRIPAYDAAGNRHELSVMPEDEKLEEERRSYPERWFAQEYMVEFLTGEGQVFQRVRERISNPPELPRAPVVVGVDLAKYSDFTCFVALDANGRMVNFARMNTVSYGIQAERCCTFLVAMKARRAVIESNGPGEVFYDILSKAMHERRSEFSGRCELIPFATTASSKKGMIDALAVAFERGQISILNNEQMITEFEQYSLATTKSGYTTFSAPEGGHDDFVMATALAYTETPARKPRARPVTASLNFDARQVGSRVEVFDLDEEHDADAEAGRVRRNPPDYNPGRGGPEDENPFIF